MSRRFKLVLWWLTFTGVLLALGWADRDTLFLEQARYCRMVADGHWPDYEHSFAQECRADGRVKGDDRDPFAEPK